MLAEPANRHRPAGIKQMMNDDQKQRSGAKTEKEHERQQPGIRKFLELKDSAKPC